MKLFFKVVFGLSFLVFSFVASATYSNYSYKKYGGYSYSKNYSKHGGGYGYKKHSGYSYKKSKKHGRHKKYSKNKKHNKYSKNHGGHWWSHGGGHCNSGHEDANLLPDAIDDSYTSEVDATFSQNILTENDDQGDALATVEYISGDVAPGLILDAQGNLTGTPTQAGQFVFKYKITDKDGDYDKAYVTVVIAETREYCAISAESSEYSTSGGHSLWIPEISTELEFVPAATVIRTFPSGDMQITGQVTDGTNTFDVDFNYTGFMDMSSDPKLELNSAAYLSNGGTVDPSAWDFYSSMTGTLVGVAGEWAGVTLDAQLRGPWAQVGVGASGKNIDLGLSNWFTFTIVSSINPLPGEWCYGHTMVGDINVNFYESCGDNEMPDAADDELSFLGGCFDFFTGLNIFSNDVLGDQPSSFSIISGQVPAMFQLTDEGDLVQIAGFPGVGLYDFQFEYQITDANGDTDAASVNISAEIYYCGS